MIYDFPSKANVEMDADDGLSVLANAAASPASSLPPPAAAASSPPAGGAVVFEKEVPAYEVDADAYTPAAAAAAAVEWMSHEEYFAKKGVAGPPYTLPPSDAAARTDSTPPPDTPQPLPEDLLLQAKTDSRAFLIRSPRHANFKDSPLGKMVWGAESPPAPTHDGPAYAKRAKGAPPEAANPPGATATASTTAAAENKVMSPRAEMMEMRAPVGHWDRWVRQGFLRKELTRISTSEELAEQEVERVALRARIDGTIRCRQEMVMEFAGKRAERSKNSHWTPALNGAMERYEEGVLCTLDLQLSLLHGEEEDLEARQLQKEKVRTSGEVRDTDRPEEVLTPALLTSAYSQQQHPSTAL